MNGMKFTIELLNLIIKLKRFTYRITVRNLWNLIPHLISCFTPIGFVIALFSGLRLFGAKGFRSLLNPLWMITLSSLIVRRRNNSYLICISPFKNINFFAQDWDSIYIYYHIWISRDYERLTEPKGIVIDCGAHIGLFALRCLKSLNTLQVVAIEPNPTNVYLLYQNLLMNRVVDKCMIIEAALGDAVQPKKELYIHSLSGRSSVLRKPRKVSR